MNNVIDFKKHKEKKEPKDKVNIIGFFQDKYHTDDEFKKPLDKEDNYEIVNVTNAVFTHSYFINRKAAETLILFNFPIKTVADNFIIFKIYCGIKITGLNPFLLKQDKNKFTSSIPIDNDLKKFFLFRRFIYKFKNRVLKKFKIFKSHKN